MSTREIPIDGPDSNTNARASAQEEELPAAEITSLEDRLTELEQERDRFRDQALRAVAELENFRRRMIAEREQTALYANERLLKALLPIVDDFHRSVESGEQNKDFDSFFQGIVMINGKLAKLFEQQGVTRIETIGHPFDVNIHEALMRQPSEAPEDTVITELEPGYRYGERVLRHAKVIVSAGS